MPTRHCFQAVFAELLVIVQQSIECSTMPTVKVFIQLVRIRLLAWIILNEFLESAIMLLVIDIRTGNRCNQSVDDLIIGRQRSREVLVLTIHCLIHIQPSDRATITDRTPSTILITADNPRCDTVQLADNLV